MKTSNIAITSKPHTRRDHKKLKFRFMNKPMEPIKQKNSFSLRNSSSIKLNVSRRKIVLVKATKKSNLNCQLKTVSKKFS